MVTRLTVLAIALLTLSACAKQLSYEERIDEHNAQVKAEYESCRAEIPTDILEKGLRSMVADGICHYSTEVTAHNGKQCVARYLRKTAFHSGQSCERYHSINDEYGEVLLEKHAPGSGERWTFAPPRELTVQDLLTGDLTCRDRSVHRDVVFAPYRLAEQKGDAFSLKHLGWHATFADGNTADLGNLNNLFDGTSCGILWRYSKNQARTIAIKELLARQP